MNVHGSIRYKAVDSDAVVQFNSGVSLYEAVKVWSESLSKAIRQARRCPEWDWHFRVCDLRRR